MTTPPEEPQVPEDAAAPTPPPPPAAPTPPAAPAGGAAPAGSAASLPPAVNEYVDALKGIRSSSLPVQLGWAGGALGILVFISVLLPWETAKVTGYGSDSVNGFGEGQHGWIPFILCIAVGAFGVFRAVKGRFGREYALAAIAAGAISFLIVLIDVIDNHGDGKDAKNLYGGVPKELGLSFHASVGNGFGIWLTLIFSVALVAVGVLALLRNDG